MMMAVAVELLLRMPLRFGNYAKLEVEKNLRSNRSSRDRVVHLVIPAEDTKTNKPFEAKPQRASSASTRWRIVASDSGSKRLNIGAMTVG